LGKDDLHRRPITMHKVIATDKAPGAIGPYSQAIIAAGFLYTSGQIPIIPSTGEIVIGAIKEQTKQVCENLKAILEEAGTDFEHVVKTTCFLSDMEDFNEFNQIYSSFFISRPARSCVAVKTLPKNVLCEIEVVAIIE
jgi:2-iminobutanoate/2-iminopropanoate deaminase